MNPYEWEHEYYHNYLAHHGRRNQKWGERHGPPYPLAPGAFFGRAKSVVKSKLAKKPKVTKEEKKQRKVEDREYRKQRRKEEKNKKEAGVLRSGDLGSEKPKKKGFLQRRKEAKISKKLEEAKKKTLSETRDAERQREEHKKEASRVLREGNATEVLKYKNEYTTKQLQEAADRIKWENTLKGYSKKDINTYLDKAEQYAKQLDRVNKLVKTGLDTKSNVEAIMKIFDDAQKHQQSQNNQKNKQQTEDIVKKATQMVQQYNKSENQGQGKKKKKR